LLRRLASRASTARGRFDDFRKRRYLERRRRVADAPHPAALYRDFLAQAKRRPGLALPRFDAPPVPAANAARLFLRHDVDTVRCIEKLPLLVEANLALGVAAPVYVRTDGIDYDPRAARDVVREAAAAGIEVGLHSSCYLAEDPEAEFRAEGERFADCYDFRPRSFTMHGLGDTRLDQRLAFVESAAGRLAQLGYAFTDAHPSLRRYDYVITDCHPDPVSATRFIYDDFHSLPGFLARGRDYLVLTHPCYWR
jgi:hypothetical protein